VLFGSVKILFYLIIVAALIAINAGGEF